MKKGVLIVFLFLANIAVAGEVPDCWDRPDEIKDGSFLIDFSAHDMTKQELLEILNRADGQHIAARRYPTVWDDHIVITVEAVDYGFGENRLSREELKQAVREELTPIAQIHGVTLSCNNIMRPSK